jgi:hypothetical protein
MANGSALAARRGHGAFAARCRGCARLDLDSVAASDQGAAELLGYLAVIAGIGGKVRAGGRGDHLHVHVRAFWLVARMGNWPDPLATWGKVRR